ncbi:MAG: LuxR family transcriptional regulator [Herpetosiphonaceae bacterium]|nr:LuxR family transcriptional regulator [Herpetosiphonaceae bacterium]
MTELNLGATALLATKMYIPPLQATMVRRARLLQLLELGQQRRLTLVAAGAGFGKTTLLSEWAAAQQPVAWVALDTGDNDVGRFLAYCIAAWQTLDPRLGSTTLALLRSPQPPATETLLTVLVNELVAAQPPAMTLILDDYSAITAPAVHAATAWLLDHLPPALRFIIATRADPPLPLGRWRARGQLAEIRADDLRFTPDETATFLVEMMGLPLAAGDVVALEARTEGWIAGLHLAALSAQGRDDLAGFVAAFTGSHRYVLDYLAEEVLGRLDSATEQFLLHTSILNRLCGPLCAAVLAAPETLAGRDAQAMLESLERAHLFVVPLDDERHWYRYHHLFADLLRYRLTQRDPAIVPLLHQRASAWHATNGLIDAAIQHSLSAGDVPGAVTLIAAHARDSLMQGEALTVRGWLSHLPPALIAESAHLAVIAAWAQLLTVQMPGIVEHLRHAEEQVGTLPDVEQQRVRGEIATIRAFIPRFEGDIRRSITLSEQALTIIAPDDLVLRGIIAGNLTVVGRLVGDVAAASRAAADAVAINQQSGNTFAALLAISDLAQLQVIQGQLQRATATFRQGLQLAVERGWRNVPALGLIHVGLGEVLYEWNDLDTATYHINEGIAIAFQSGYLDIATDGYLVLARLKQARGDHAGATEVLRQAEKTAQRNNVARFIAQVAAHQARLALIRGDLATANRWASSHNLHEQEEFDLEQAFVALTLARLHIAANHADRALRLTARLIEDVQASGNVGALIKLALVQALAYAAQHRGSNARQQVITALNLAEGPGYLRVFIDAGPEVATLLRQLPAAEAPAYAQEVLAAMLEASNATAKAAQSLVEPLSERELEVLRLLAAGLSNAAIAERLVITVGTVKRHLNNLNGKLATRSRTEAIAKAREIGLLR